MNSNQSSSGVRFEFDLKSSLVRAGAKAEFLENKDLTNEDEIRQKLEEAHGGTDVIEKFVLQVVQSEHDPNHYVANMRPEMEFLELSGTPYGREDPEGEHQQSQFTVNTHNELLKYHFQVIRNQQGHQLQNRK